MYDLLTLQEWIRALYAISSPGQRLVIEPYAYPVSFPAFNCVSGAVTTPFNINANADFICTRISYAATPAGAVVNVGNKPVAAVKAQIIDAGSARPFFANAVPLENFASNEYPNRFLAYPRVMEANTSMTVTLTGYATFAETLGIELLFEGVNVRGFSGV